MTPLLLLTTFLLVGVCLSAFPPDPPDDATPSDSPPDPPESDAASHTSHESQPSRASSPPDSPARPDAFNASDLSHLSTAINSRILLPDPVAHGLEVLAAELEWRTRDHENLDPESRDRRFRRDFAFTRRILGLYKTIAQVETADPDAAPVDPADYLPAHVAEGVHESEQYFAELTRAWRIWDAHPTAAEIDRALTALTRIVALRRSAWDLSRVCSRPADFPGWDADRRLNPFDEEVEFIVHEGCEAPDPDLLHELLRPRVPGATPASDASDPDPSDASGPAHRSDPSSASSSPVSVPVRERPCSSVHPSNFSPSKISDFESEILPSAHPLFGSAAFPRSPWLRGEKSSDRALAQSRLGALNGKQTPSPSSHLSHSSSLSSVRHRACIPLRLLRLIHREGAGLLYLRPWFRNPVVRRMAHTAGLLCLYFAPPDLPAEEPSEAEKAWWRAREQEAIRRVFRPEIEGEMRDPPPPSLPPWGYDDPPWER